MKPTQNTNFMKWNRKGFENVDIILIIILIYAIGSLIFGWSSSSRTEACKKIGLEDQGYWDDEPVCKDIDGNIHFVNMDCKYNFFPFVFEKDCKANKIKVGEVWGSIG